MYVHLDVLQLPLYILDVCRGYHLLGINFQVLFRYKGAHESSKGIDESDNVFVEYTIHLMLPSSFHQMLLEL